MIDRLRKKVLTAEGLERLRKENSDKTIVFATGCYDILQSGHAVFFHQCKDLGDLLVVGVGRDQTLTQLKGPGRPVNPEQNRLFLIAAMHDVDYVVLNDDALQPGKIDFQQVMHLLRPDVFVLNDDDSSIEPKQALCSQVGTTIKFVSRVVPPELEATSTTNIINKINYGLKAPLRIDFAGGWTDIPYIMYGEKGYVSNVAISPLIEYRNGAFNFAGYPRGSGLSTSTAVKVLEMLNSKTYNAEGRTLTQIGEDLFNLENKELNWFIGRQDQYGIVFGGFHTFEFGDDYGKPLPLDVSRDTLEAFRKHLLLLHTGVSRNAQSAVEGVYKNHKTDDGRKALQQLAEYGRTFGEALAQGDFRACADIMAANWEAQKLLTPASTNENLDAMYDFALENGAWGGKICGAGGGGAFVFCCDDPEALKNAMKRRFVDCFEISFEFEYQDVKTLNPI
ncbi:cytidyltransferase-like domain-containing protein [Catalinimonas alkaloidigena]|uniref:Cytidyltransferase-like domain-containing protein n=1 Tax=Catalinimonas alkaloidigena TaxID=1075417 RepID=A0A1G9BC27_9BACT|nr:adenylyltransferase/cytidyltransferase family protein [Catalinimonas alkaloidigena]SDK36640.1 cytidyltransferase-like domain-containing protein [Catalinimonas alkaloidigena]